MPQIFSLLFLCFPSCFLSSFTTSFHHFNCHSLSALCLIFFPLPSFPYPPSFSLIGALLSLVTCFHLWEQCDRGQRRRTSTPSLFVCVCVLHSIYTPITVSRSVPHMQKSIDSQTYSLGVMHSCVCSCTFCATLNSFQSKYRHIKIPKVYMPNEAASDGKNSVEPRDCFLEFIIGLRQLC